MFTKIEIKISLNKAMEADMPTSGKGEMVAIDKHAAAIGRILLEPLHELKEGLEALGYEVVIDEV